MSNPAPSAALSDGVLETRHRLAPLFNPTSIALVGASDRSVWSGLIEASIRTYGFSGSVYYVNPRGGTAHGHRLYERLADLPEVPDLIFVMIPAKAVLSLLQEAAELGVPAAEILSSGFAEVGEEGAELQRQIAMLAEEAGMAVLGPNNLGFTNVISRLGLSPSASDQMLKPGSIAMVSQSGNLMGQIQGLATTFDVGLSLLVSTGNEVDIAVSDVIDYIVDDPDTKAIGVFAETIRNPTAFREAALRARQAGKLVIVLKVGRSEAAARSAMAHTGSFVGNDAAVDAALRAAGAIRVDSLEDLLATADVFARLGEIKGRRLGIVSISGGAGDIAGDLAETAGLELPLIHERTADELRLELPDYGTAQNPLDMTGAVVPRPELFGYGLEVLSRDPHLDVVLAITEAEHRAASIDDPMLGPLLRAAASSPIPALLTTTTIQSVPIATRQIRDGHDWPTVSWGLDRVISAIANLESWTNNDVLEMPPAPSPIDPYHWGEPVGTWSETRSRALLSEYGVPVVPALHAGGAEGVAAAMQDQEGPFALKIVSDDIPHKSDVGGVRLNVARTEIESTIGSMLEQVAEAAPGARLDGVVISPMRTGGVELLVGVVRDPEWGCVLAIAMGGIWTEVLGDVQRLALPTTPAKIQTALENLRSAPLLHGARGTRPVDVHALSAVIATIAEVAIALGDNLAALEVNPLRADGDLIEALDAMAVWTEHVN